MTPNLPIPPPDRTPGRFQHLDRRRFIRNVGLCLALPALESFSRSRAFGAVASGEPKLAATTATGAPLRTAFIYAPNGAIPAHWLPTGAGKDFTFNRTLESLTKMKSHVQVLSGLDVVAANPGPDGGGDHARANATFLTNTRIKKTDGADFHAGISIDQIMAKQIGLLTPFRSLELSCESILNVGACDSGYACVYQHNLAWSSATTPLTPEVNPRLLFERLFGAGPPAERARNLLLRQQQKRSVLDFLREDSSRLVREVSGRDKQKLDEYFTSVRDIELRIQAAEKSLASRPQPDTEAPEPGVPENIGDYIRLMFDMMHLAFQTDSTRVVTFMFAGDGSNREFSHIGIKEGHHDLSHHGNRPEWMERVSLIERWYVEQFAYFLEKMEATKDIDGHSLLHNSQIVYGSGNSDSNRHTHTDLPILLAGHGGGTLQPGRYVQCGSQPLANLYLSMVDRIKPDSVDRFADSTGRLKNI